MSGRRKPQSRRPQAATGAVKTHVRKILLACRADTETTNAKIREIEAAGGRIVTGGQTGEYDDHGGCDWEIEDWRTGEILAEGHGARADFDAAWTRLDPDGRWRHVDRIHADPTDATPTEGVPRSLADALDDWACTPAHTDDVAAFVGWTADDVRRCTDEGGSG